MGESTPILLLRHDWAWFLMICRVPEFEPPLPVRIDDY